MINFNFESFEQLRAIESAYMAIKTDRVYINFENAEELTLRQWSFLKKEVLKIAKSWDLSDFLEMGEEDNNENSNSVLEHFLSSALGSINNGEFEGLEITAEIKEA